MGGHEWFQSVLRWCSYGLCRKWTAVSVPLKSDPMIATETRMIGEILAPLVPLKQRAQLRSCSDYSERVPRKDSKVRLWCWEVLVISNHRDYREPETLPHVRPADRDVHEGAHFVDLNPEELEKLRCR